MIKLFLLILMIANAYSQDSEPENAERYFNLGGNFRVFKRFKTTSLKISGEYKEKYKDQDYSKLELGAYYRLGSRTRLGLFLLEEKGLRHTDDWIFKGQGNWQWRDTSSRKEYLAQIVYKRLFRTNMFSSNLYELKLTYQHNFFNDQNLVIARPSIHHFIFKRGVPKYSFKFALPIYIPLNFEKNFVYKFGMYNSALWHKSPHFMLGLSYKLLVETWTTSSDSKRIRPSSSYTSQDITQLIGVNFIFNI